MPQQYLPVYKKSGRGMAKDLLTLKKQDAFTAGWLRGQYLRYMPRLAGYKNVNGKLCYGEEIRVDGWTNPSDGSRYSKDIRKFFSLLGMDDSNFRNIYNTYKEDGVDKIIFKWEEQQTFELGDFEFLYETLRESISFVKKIEFIHESKDYQPGETLRPPIPAYQKYSNYGEYTYPRYKYNAINDKYILIEEQRYNHKNVAFVWDTIELKYYDVNNVDITNSISATIDYAMRAMVFMSGNLLGNLLSITKLSEYQEFEDSDEGSYSTGWVIRSKETYELGFKTSYAKNAYDLFQEDGMTGYSNENNIITGTRYLAPTIANKFWQLSSFFAYHKTSSKRQSIFYDGNGETYLTVEGLKKGKIDDLIYYMSRYAKFDIIEEEDDGGFLGIGGFVGEFIGGIINGIVKAVSAIAQLGYYMPEIRSVNQLLIWIFKGEWTNDKDAINAVTTRILLVIIAIIIVWLSDGSAWEYALAIITGAYGVYSTIKDLSFEEPDKKPEEVLEDEIDIFGELLELAKDDAHKNYLYEGMFDSFGSIDRSFINPFDAEGMYNPRFGLG